MKNWVVRGLLIGQTIGSLSYAAEALDLRLRAKLTYEDKNYSCDTGRLGIDLLLKGEIDKGELTALKVANVRLEWASQWIYRELKLPISKNDYELIKIDGRWWFKKLSLSEPILRFVLNIGSNGNFFCKLPRPIHSARADIELAKFELEGVEDGVEVSYSDAFKVSGRRDDKVPYDVSIRLIQRSPSKTEPELFPELNIWSK